MELVRCGIDGPLRTTPPRENSDSCQDRIDACAYIASHLRVKELSFNSNFTIHQDFQRFRWVQDLAEMRGLRAVFHHNSPHEHRLKSSKASILLANQMSRHNWGTNEYRWEALLKD